MGGNEDDGYYCTICGGIPPDKIKIRKILVDGKETGIDRFDWILKDVAGLNLTDDKQITEEITKRAQQFNYIPTRMTAAYEEAFLREYKKMKQEEVS
jgi:hypothetical protein